MYINMMILKWLQFQEQCVHQLLLEMEFLLLSLSLLEALVDACPKEGICDYIQFIHFFHIIIYVSGMSVLVSVSVLHRSFNLCLKLAFPFE